MIHHRQSDMNGTSGFTPVTIIYTDGPAKTAHLARKTAFWLRSGRTAEGILTSTRLADRRTLADLWGPFVAEANLVPGCEPSLERIGYSTLRREGGSTATGMPSTSRLRVIRR